MLKNLLYCSFIILCFLVSCFLIYKNEKPKTNTAIKNIKVYNIKNEQRKINEDNIGKLIIKKINLENNLYDINNKKNNVNQNVTILSGSIYPEIENSIMFIAAHSGTGEIAYFKNLDKLSINDEINLIFKNKNYNYIIKNIWEANKDGNIEVTKEDKKQLILTTCSQKNKNKQLIINCTEKES